jgi:hypothetical protein
MATVHLYSIYIAYKLSRNVLHFFPSRPLGLTGCLPAQNLPSEAMIGASVHRTSFFSSSGHASIIQNDQQLAISPGAVRDVTRPTQLNVAEHDNKQFPGGHVAFPTYIQPQTWSHQEVHALGYDNGIKPQAGITHSTPCHKPLSTYSKVFNSGECSAPPLEQVTNAEQRLPNILRVRGRADVSQQLTHIVYRNVLTLKETV